MSEFGTFRTSILRASMSVVGVRAEIRRHATMGECGSPTTHLASPSMTRASVGCGGGKGHEQTQIIAKAIGRLTPTAPPSIITKSRSRRVPT
jgi:hypothetical protein